MSSKRFSIAVSVFGIILLAAFSALAQTAGQKNTSAAQPKVAHANPSSEADEGDRIFQQQCSRCHNAPEGFSPRISGTIVRHMRMRAALSKHDEEELLRFFNP